MKYQKQILLNNAASIIFIVPYLMYPLHLNAYVKLLNPEYHDLHSKTKESSVKTKISIKIILNLFIAFIPYPVL